MDTLKRTCATCTVDSSSFRCGRKIKKAGVTEDDLCHLYSGFKFVQVRVVWIKMLWSLREAVVTEEDSGFVFVQVRVVCNHRSVSLRRISATCTWGFAFVQM